MKNRILIAVIAILGILAGYLYLKDKGNRGTIKEERRDFAVEDTASITKIFLVNKAQKSVTLTRVSKGRWKVNEKYYARRDLINVLLKTINLLKVKSPVSKASRNNVITRLASGATKVEIYQGADEPAKVYYVGGATQSTMGTYMLIEGSSEPFITHLPSFFGYLSTRYVTNLDLWRDKTFIDLQFKDIRSIAITAIKILFFICCCLIALQFYSPFFRDFNGFSFVIVIAYHRSGACSTNRFGV